MIQKCSLINVLEVFFKEPTEIHFIKEISRKINLAPTSVRNHINELLKEDLITKKQSSPFDGLIANRDSDKFQFYKRSHNLYSLYNLTQEIIQKIAPKAIILFGSYSRGDDIETSDIDLVVLTKIKKDIDLTKLEKQLNRKIHITFVKEINDLEKNIKENIKGGIVLYGRY